MKNEKLVIKRGEAWARAIVLLALASCHPVDKGQIAATSPTSVLSFSRAL